MAKKKPQKVELCAASYRAEQLPGTVVIHATGVHNTTGYRVFFEESPAAVFPPPFLLFHSRPAGIVHNVVTPFSISTSFHADQEVKQVVIQDANGKHTVAVEHLSVRALDHMAEDAPRLTGIEAETIVFDCIREAVGFNGPIRAQNSLKEVGVVDDNAVEALRDEIVTNPNRGVPSKGFAILPGALVMDEDTKVFDLRDQVSKKAVKV